MKVDTKEHYRHIQEQLKTVIEEVTGYDISDTDEEAQFSELGLDSLLLTQIATAIEGQFAVGLTFRHLVEGYTCLKDLTTFVADKIPPAISTVTVAPAPAAAAPAATTHGTAVPAVPSMLPTAMRLNDPIALGGNSMQDLMNAQLQIMQMQLQVLNGSGASIPAVPSAVATAVPARIEPVV